MSDVDMMILTEMRKKRDDFISGEALAGRLGVSRSAVWKRITALREKGYEFDSEPSKGYRLASSPDRLSPLEVGPLKKSAPVSGPIHHREKIESTNSEAMSLAQKGEPEGAMVIAESQSAGRGRLGRKWESPHGKNLYLSIILRPPLPPSETPPITLLTAVAVAETLRDDYGLPVRIKWPNDVLIENLKISGILTEMAAEIDRVRYVVLGVGVNLNLDREDMPDEIKKIATSVKIEKGEKIDRAIFLRSLLDRLGPLYSTFLEDGFAKIAERWRELAKIEGRRGEGTAQGGVIGGTARGLAPDGALILQGDDGEERLVYAGDMVEKEG